MQRLADGALDRQAGPAVLGSFSMVMATGIVAAALRRDGLTPAADVVLAVAAAELVALAVVAGWRVTRQPDALRAELARPRRAFTAFTLSAACGVVGMGLATSGLPAAGAVLAVAGGAAWLAMTVLIPARMAVSRRARPVLADVNGTWYLWAVATQSLAIMVVVLLGAGVLAAGPAAVAALAAWLAGLAIYVLTTALVVARLWRAGAGPPGARTGYWIAMGAASISVLAAAHILSIRGVPAVAAARPPITAAAVALWLLATCLAVVLATATGTLWLRSRRRPKYDPSAWMLVFPLGMYATASQQLGVAARLYPVRLAGEIFTWPAAAAWLAVLAAMAAAPNPASLAVSDLGSPNCVRRGPAAGRRRLRASARRSGRSAGRHR
jgi:tellurite resistance protein TehA-like permease